MAAAQRCWVRVGPRQELKQDYRTVAHDRCSGTVQDLALAALNISLDEAHAHQAKLIKRAHFDVKSLHVAELRVRPPQVASKVKDHPVV